MFEVVAICELVIEHSKWLSKCLKAQLIFQRYKSLPDQFSLTVLGCQPAFVSRSMAMICLMKLLSFRSPVTSKFESPTYKGSKSWMHAAVFVKRKLWIVWSFFFNGPHRSFVVEAFFLSLFDEMETFQV